jgi:amino-acid N-acetyltransferase
MTIMIRKMKTGDVPEVHRVLAQFAGEGKLLARSLSELYTNIRDTYVAIDSGTGQVIGCCSLHVVWEDLAEIRSLAVVREHHGRGLGRRLVEACVTEAKSLEIGRIFVLTYETGFFAHVGFQLADKKMFPQKIWADCLHCPKFPDCDEVAMLLELPTEAIEAR